MGAVGAIVGIAALILAPIAPTLLQMSLSRRREYQADASAVEISATRRARRALQKLRRRPASDEKVTRATAHMYIESPLRDHAGLRAASAGCSTPTRPRGAHRAAGGDGRLPDDAAPATDEQ